MNEKVVAALLILAIVFSMVSIAVTMNLSVDEIFPSQESQPEPGSRGNVELVVNEGGENGEE